MNDIRLQIMRLLLNKEEDLSVREIARRLERPSGHVFYHLKRLYEMGILTRDQIDERVYYTPQMLFTEDVEGVLETLMGLNELIDDSDEKKISNCIVMFLKCYPPCSV